jgi:glutamate synthase domain-containing protein 3
VRNSGALAVVEGVGDHGCEYMTGGRVVVLGRTGRNFAAGMSGGVAYVFDADDTFAKRVNGEMVDVLALDTDDRTWLASTLADHVRHTDSPLAARMLADWEIASASFKKVMPRDYARVLAVLEAAKQEGLNEEETAQRVMETISG